MSAIFAGARRRPLGPGEEGKTEKLVIRCKPQTATRFKVRVADQGVDQETFLNRLLDYWSLTHLGTFRPMPGKTYGPPAGTGYRP